MRSPEGIRNRRARASRKSPTKSTFRMNLHAMTVRTSDQTIRCPIISNCRATPRREGKSPRGDNIQPQQGHHTPLLPDLPPPQIPSRLPLRRAPPEVVLAPKMRNFTLAHSTWHTHLSAHKKAAACANFRRPNRRLKPLADMTQEVLRAVALGVIEHLVGRALLDDNAAVHEDDAVGHIAGEAHLVCNHNHRHAATRELFHDA